MKQNYIRNFKLPQVFKRKNHIMRLTKTFAVTLLIFISLSSKAQYYKLLNLTEKQIREKITEFPIVTRDSSEHEFVPFLEFKNKNNETQLICVFFSKKCYLIKQFTKPESFDSIVNLANKQFVKIGKERWKNKENTFEVTMTAYPEKVITRFSWGISVL